jgi:hypothetical protein
VSSAITSDRVAVARPRTSRRSAFAATVPEAFRGPAAPGRHWRLCHPGHPCHPGGHGGTGGVPWFRGFPVAPAAPVAPDDTVTVGPIGGARERPSRAPRPRSRRHVGGRTPEGTAGSGPTQGLGGCGCGCGCWLVRSGVDAVRRAEHDAGGRRPAGGCADVEGGTGRGRCGAHGERRRAFP